MSMALYPNIRLNCAQIESAAQFIIRKNTTRQKTRPVVSFKHRSNQAPKTKKRQKMADGKKGAAKVYNIDLEAIKAAGGKVTAKKLEATGQDKKVYTQDTNEVEITDLNQALASVGNNEEQLWKLFSRALNGVVQAGDRVKLRNAAQGAAVSAARMVRALVAGGIPEADSIDMVVTKLTSQGTPVSAEDIKAQL